MLDYADWLITPVSNPDGYEYTWTTVHSFIIIRLIILSVFSFESIIGSPVAQEQTTGKTIHFASISFWIILIFFLLFCLLHVRMRDFATELIQTAISTLDSEDPEHPAMPALTREFQLHAHSIYADLTG